MKKVFLNGLQIGRENTGVQYYAEYLYAELKKLKSNTIHIEISSSNNRNSLKRILYENFCLESYLKRKECDLYHTPNYVLPRFWKLPSIVTIHDLITLDYPDLCKNQSVVYFNLLMRSTLKKAKKIITVSNTVKLDIIRHFGVNEEKIKVIHLGIDPIFKKTENSDIASKYKLPEKYILFVGTIEGKKNLTRLLQAYKKLLQQDKITHKLVIVGKLGWKYKSMYQVIKEFDLEQQILFTGYVPKEDLPVLYSFADVFVFPSIYEGFGIPPLEAMACEVPVLVSREGASPEICGSACIKVDPYNIDDIANGIEILIHDEELRKKNIALSKEWVKQYSWEKTAKETIKVYEEVFNK
ncbi:glycosyltransferase family 4 protein [Aquimarina pacifica]|uniref:glycosyltransferase family 4 protein n=1 Tax=Aquimarina pacifica TaxID=1296415 RepID=UPI00046EA845|nr:glycosyltransferase family 1 protein [Aquimarina pacifica]